MPAMTQTPTFVPATPDGDPSLTPSRVLSEALGMLRLTGAVYLRGEFRAPWGLLTPATEGIVETLCPTARQLVVFHAVIEGTCHARLATGESVTAEEGDFIILPYGSQHSLFYPATVEPVPIDEILPPPPWPGLHVSYDGSPDGARTRLLCAYLDCSDMLFNPLLQALPPLLVVRPKPGPAMDWLRATIRYSSEMTPEVLAHDPLGSRLPELLLVETLRQHFATLPAASTGWLAALSDPLIGDALLRIHGDPARPWTVPLLAEELAVSRSVFATRFTDRLGQSPMRYVAQWRLQLACHLLQTTDVAVSTIAVRVGYESEPAFSRAFKRAAGVAPGAWRRRDVPHRGDEGEASDRPAPRPSHRPRERAKPIASRHAGR